ncbi:response regulator [Variovorax sp. UMC13]|uniref:response regulator n=1 Tax=Variovorax sp. UMC13 TaxID=1862326 RepID=UPI0016037E63|nr:response regulator [Variovorax sp. UMC13]MBB1604562.1 two-component system sensor histidine kinase/response regulator [Variovorax sp. UMC13]
MSSPDPAARPGHAPPLRVLILEDSRFDAELLTETLDRTYAAIETTIVQDEQAFVQALAHDRFDVILSDFELPGFSGGQALELARKAVPSVPFIFVSGVIGEDNAVELLKRGATDYVSKGRLARLPLVLERALKEAADRRTLGIAEHRLRDAHAAADRIESRRMALIELSDHIRDMDDPAAMAYMAAQMLGRQLGVDRAGYGVVDTVAETIVIERDWNAPGVHSLAGVMRFRDYGSYIEDLKHGVTVAFADAREDPRTHATAAALEAIRARAVVNMPMTEQGGLVGLLYLNHGEVRPWPSDELEFVRDVGDRLRSAIARREAQIALTAFAASLERQVEARAAELEAAKEQLRQSQKLEAVGQLTGGLAHDFNNLLAAISGSLELMRRRGPLARPGDLERYIGVAQGATQRAAALTHRLLAFSRRQTLEPRHLDLNELIHGMEDLIRRTVGPEITLDVHAAPGLWSAHVDAGQFENSLLNLCINARDAMPGGGRLVIETANLSLDAQAARAADLSPGAYVSICVRDSGVGMSEEVAQRAFDPFFTTKPLGMGTGLGLSMIYGFAKQSGGRVGIRSKVGEGTTVTIELPRSEMPAEAQATQPQGLEPAPRAPAGETVLVVDDEAALRMLIVEVMQELGYATLEAGNGAEALRWLHSGRQIDLLITDVGLPGGMNGRQVADAARTGRPQLKVLFITGYAESVVLGQGSFDRDMHVMTKPFEMHALARRVKDLIDGP